MGGDPRGSTHGWPRTPRGSLHLKLPPQELTKNLVRVLQLGDRHGGIELGTEGTLREEGAAPRCLPGVPVSRGKGGGDPRYGAARKGLNPPLPRCSGSLGGGVGAPRALAAPGGAGNDGPGMLDRE